MTKNLALICLTCVILEISTVKAYDEVCNATIHDGQPFRVNTAYANETHPAIISCWIKLLNTSQHPEDYVYNPLLVLFLTDYDGMESIHSTSRRVEDLYVTDVTFLNTSNTEYHKGFEYRIFMFNQSVDCTVAICGTRYYNGSGDKKCLATAFTLIRYNSKTITITTPPTIEKTTTTKTMTTTDTTPTENTTTEKTPFDANATTEMRNQTSDETKTPLTTIPVPPETATQEHSGPLVTGLSLGTSILVLMVVILVLIVGILWVKLRTVSADIKVQRATCTCARNLDQSLTKTNTKVVSDSEGEENENPSPNSDQ